MGLKLALVGWLCAVASAAEDATTTGPPSKSNDPNHQVPFLENGDPNFLFLGNSYTSANDLPWLVQQLLEAGVPEWDGRVHTKRRDNGGERLLGHLQQLDGTRGNQTPLRQWMIHENTRQHWKWVCLQDQSQIPGFYSLGHGPGGREYAGSLLAVEKLNELVKENRAQTLLLMTWARRNGDPRNDWLFPDFPTMQEHIYQGYHKYWRVTNTEERPVYMAPAGLVFSTIYNDIVAHGQDPLQANSLFYQLYASDGSHPSLAGSYLFALTIYATITGKNPKEVTWFPPALEKDVCMRIQDAVNRTVLQTYASHTIEYPWQLPWPNHDDVVASVEL